MHAVHNLHHVTRNADVASLIGHCASHRLSNPPGCIRGKLETLFEVVFIRSMHEADVALLNQVGQLQFFTVVSSCN